MILTLPILPLSQTLHTLMIVPALACALVGRLTSIAVTVTAAMCLGALQSVVAYWSTQDWWPDWAQTGLNDAVPFIVVIVVLFVLGQKLPTRATLRPDPLPKVVIPRNRPKVIIPLVAVALALVLMTQGSWRFGVITSMILTIAVMSIVLLTGLTGQISLAQAGLAGLAGFALSKLAEHGVGFPWAVLIAASIAALFGVIVGLPALRIRGAELAVVTLALAVAIERFLFRNPSFAEPGGEPIPNASFLGIDLGIRDGEQHRSVAVRRHGARRARGRLARRVEPDPRLNGSTVHGIPRQRASRGGGRDQRRRQQALAFAIAAFLAGIAGSLIGYSRNQLSADSFSTFSNVSLVAFAYLGGITEHVRCDGRRAPRAVGAELRPDGSAVRSRTELLARGRHRPDPDRSAEPCRNRRRQPRDVATRQGTRPEPTCRAVKLDRSSRTWSRQPRHAPLEHRSIPNVRNDRSDCAPRSSR